MSATEITLRNAIDSAFVKFSGKRWWTNKKLKYKNHSSVTGINSVPFDIAALKKKFLSAESYVIKEKKRRYHKNNYIPTHEEIIAGTDFSTWEFVISTELLGPNLFWGAMITQVFKGDWPNTSGAKTMSIARDLTKTIREFRNRVAHNEPLWKAYHVHTPQDAVIYLQTKIDAIEQLIRLISPEHHNLLTKHQLFKNARRACTLAEIERFKMTTPINILDSMFDLYSVVERFNRDNVVGVCKLRKNSKKQFLIVPR
ncbi:Abi family protein [Photorhabdus temperata]|uniref:Abi family protein n=1 Tax=Photorhabdus temperata TaxID=574560 RepID=UPI000389DCC0|nr:hypothetical protein B738_28517 [Photorhabdus temperata subsp. temperata M1021]